MDSAPHPPARIQRRQLWTAVSAMPARHFLGLVGALVLVWSAMLVVQGGAVDHALVDRLYLRGNEGLRAAAFLITELGIRPLLYCFLVAWIFLMPSGRRAVPGAVAFFILLSGRISVEWQKEQFARPRPPEELHLVEVYTYAFPSGHTANSTMAYLTAALLAGATSRWRRRRTALLLGAICIAASIGITRILLGVHSPADVIGGWAFGALWAVLWLRAAAAAEGTLERRFRSECPAS